ncbi:MAG: NPCBM/NEW2 domain-containing protein [Prolixibacteraceae bacterium]
MTKLKNNFTLLLLLVFSIGLCHGQQKSVWLDELNIQTYSDGIASVNTIKPGGIDSIIIGRIKQERGIRVQTTSAISFLLNGNAAQFSAVIGADEKGNKSIPIRFFVVGDRKILFESKKIVPGEMPVKVSVDLKGIKRLGLLVTGDEEDQFRTSGYWANAQLLMSKDQLPAQLPNTDEKQILTPEPGKSPRINSASVFGATPGNQLSYTIAATGDRPLRFAANDLPGGLSLDPSTGIISGKILQKGVYPVTLTAENKSGKSSKKLLIKIGATIGLTPPIGWNGWNSWAKNIDREKVIASADAMVKMGLNQHGWSYINIDDTWEGQRGGKFNALQPNEKFPKFKEMIDYIHSLGLKLGIYSTPWISTYAGFAGASSDFEKGQYPDSIKNNKRAYRHLGKYRFEKEDALQMAEWGVDYLKYDWRIDLNSAERMSVALQKSGRDILFSLSNSAPFENAKDWARVSNAWRTGPDIRDSWLSLYISAFTIDKWAPFAQPGHWNDPDMLILGNVTTGTDLHPTRLTPDEQYSHVSLFSLLAAPLIIGCPIEQLDAFTLNLLTNDEVIEINQDPLGKPARLLAEEHGVQIWVKPMQDGSFAVGLFNTADFGKTPPSYFRWGDEQQKKFSFDFEKVGLKGKYKIRDLWRQKDLGNFDGSFNTEIGHHGVVLVRLDKI